MGRGNSQETRVALACGPVRVRDRPQVPTAMCVMPCDSPTTCPHHPLSLQTPGIVLQSRPTPAHVHRCLRPLSGGCDLCCSRSVSGWAGPHLAGWCSRCCQPAAGSAPLQESAEQRDSQRGPQRACRRRAGGYRQGGGGDPLTRWTTMVPPPYGGWVPAISSTS